MGSLPERHELSARSRRRVVSTLSLRLILVAVSVVVVMMSAYLWLVHKPVREELLRMEAAKVKTLASGIVRQLRTDLEAAWGELSTLAALPVMRSLEGRDIDRHLLAAEGVNTYFRKFSVLDAEGRVVARPSEPAVVGADRSDREYFKGPMDRSGGYVTGPQLHDGVLGLSMARPITVDGKVDGKVVGVLAGHVEVSGQNPRLCSAVTGVFEPEHYTVSLLSREGVPIASSTGPIDLVDFSAAAWLRHPLSETRPVNIRDGVPVTYALDDVSYYGIACEVPLAEWVLLVQADLAPILAKVETLVNRLAWLIGVVFVLVLVVVVLYMSHVVQPVTRLTSALVDFGKVGEAQPLQEVTASGEVGEALLAFNQMVVERSEVEARLVRQRRELQALTTELARTEQRMRHEIAGELHDHISQNLAACKIRLEMLRSRQTSDAREDSLRVAIGLLHECIHSTSDLTKKLAQPALAQLGLVHAIGALVAEYQAQHPVVFEFEDCAPIEAVDETVADTLYRGVGELLHNIIKHAGARRASVTLARDDGCLRLTVADDGVGFGVQDLGPRAGTVGGFGLFSFRERVHQLGGTFEVKSSPGSGCVVTVEVPLDRTGLKETG